MSTRPKNKIGRPTDYTLELAKEICDAIASSSIGIKRLCKEHPNWPSHNTIYRWVANHPEFRDQYAQAKQCQVELLVDEILEIADDSTQDHLVSEDGHARCNSEWIARSRLRIDTRKWLASKLVPKVYGGLQQVATVPNLSILEKLILDDQI